MLERCYLPPSPPFPRPPTWSCPFLLMLPMPSAPCMLCVLCSVSSTLCHVLGQDRAVADWKVNGWDGGDEDGGFQLGEHAGGGGGGGA